MRPSRRGGRPERRQAPPAPKTHAGSLPHLQSSRNFMSALRNDERRMGDRILDDDAGQAKYLFDHFLGDDRRRPALRRHLPLAQGNEMAGIAAGLVEVVEHHDNGSAAIHVEVAQKFQELDLMRQVEECRRLVCARSVDLRRASTSRSPTGAAASARKKADPRHRWLT